MRNKRLTIVFSILLVIVLLIILSSTIFAVDNISIVFSGTTNYLTNKEQEIINSAQFTQGQSIFFINKNYYIKKMEKNNPYLNVLSIESVFPNKLIIHSAERINFACINNSGTYVVFDNELYVTTTQNSRVGQNQPILINLEINRLNVTKGVEVQLSRNQKELIKNILFCLQEWNLSINELQNSISEISLNYEIDNQILISMTSGLSIIIKSADINLSDKMNLAFSYYDSNYMNCKNGGELLVLKTNDNIITGYYTAPS